MKTPQPSQSPTISRPTLEVASLSNALQHQGDQDLADNDDLLDDTARRPASRKGTGGLRVASNQWICEDLSEHQRQMQVEARSFPKRRKIASEKFVFQPSTLDKLIVGIWEQVNYTEVYFVYTCLTIYNNF
jgi:ATP-dependent RNA helicase DDX49/DBP8